MSAKEAREFGFSGADEGSQGLEPHLRTARFGLRTGQAKNKGENQEDRADRHRGPDGREMCDIGAESAEAVISRKPERSEVSGDRPRGGGPEGILVKGKGVVNSVADGERGSSRLLPSNCW